MRKVGEQSLLYSCYSTSAWIEEVMVRRLRLGPCVPIAYLLVHSNAMLVETSNTGRSDSMCHHDPVRNGFHRPVLKHGPRSLTSMRVFGCKTLMRNESKGSFGC